MTPERSTALEDIVSRVVALRDRRLTVLVAIDGPGGSGKSFLADAISSGLNAAGTSCAIVHTDDFFLPSGQRATVDPSAKPIGADVDWCRLRDQVLAPLRRGEVARYDRYDWDRDVIGGMCEVAAVDVVIVEGVYSTREELAAFYDLRIWVDCPRALRLARGVARDGEAGRARWEQDWMPSEDRYIAEHRPREHAHIVFSGTAI